MPPPPQLLICSAYRFTVPNIHIIRRPTFLDHPSNLTHLHLFDMTRWIYKYPPGSGLHLFSFNRGQNDQQTMCCICKHVEEKSSSHQLQCAQLRVISPAHRDDGSAIQISPLQLHRHKIKTFNNSDQQSRHETIGYR